MTKWCPDCRHDLPIDKFTKNRRMRDGHSFYCIDCQRIRQATSRERRRAPGQRRYRTAPARVPDGHKWCPECGEIKAIEQFARNAASPSGYGSYCRPCHNTIGKENREANGGSRNYHLRRRYGITAEHADRMLAEQGGVCAICREAPAGHVDHDHATGRIRGLLCFNCNGALGQFRDRKELMLRAIAYLDGADFGELADVIEIGGFLVTPLANDDMEDTA